MGTENVELMKQAQESLKGKWGLAVGTFFVYLLIVQGGQIIFRFAGMGSVGALPLLIIAGPMALGLSIFSLSLARNQDAKFEQLFAGFQNFAVSLGAYLLMVLFILLWSILLIIPGIIAAMSYSMTFYILADDNTIGAMDALNNSKAMMDGYKMKLFYLYLRFFGWALLCILTLGIGFLWLLPYITVTTAKFYDDINGKQVTSDISNIGIA